MREVDVHPYNVSTQGMFFVPGVLHDDPDGDQEQYYICPEQQDEVRLLMLDEVHNILAGSAKEQRILLNTLRYVSNELQISLVCLGISEAREAIGGDVQLARRFEELSLQRWQGDEEFQEFIVCMLRHLPLKQASQISSRALRQVLQVTEGVTARVFRMFNDLAVAAIRAGAECINDSSIDAWRPMTAPNLAYA